VGSGCGGSGWRRRGRTRERPSGAERIEQLGQGGASRGNPGGVCCWGACANGVRIAYWRQRPMTPDAMRDTNEPPIHGATLPTEGGGHTGGRGLCAGGDQARLMKRGVAAPYPRAGWTVIRAPIHKATRGGILSNSQQRRPTTGPGTVPLRSIGAVAAPASEPLRPSPLPTDRVPGPHGESPAKRCDVSWRLGVSVRWTPRVAQASPAPLTGCPDMARHAQTLRPSLDDANPDD
jgi:hypothetical protein